MRKRKTEREREREKWSEREKDRQRGKASNEVMSKTLRNSMYLKPYMVLITWSMPSVHLCAHSFSGFITKVTQWSVRDTSAIATLVSARREGARERGASWWGFIFNVTQFHLRADRHYYSHPYTEHIRPVQQRQTSYSVKWNLRPRCMAFMLSTFPAVLCQCHF